MKCFFLRICELLKVFVLLVFCSWTWNISKTTKILVEKIFFPWDFFFRNLSDIYLIFLLFCFVLHDFKKFDAVIFLNQALGTFTKREKYFEDKFFLKFSFSRNLCFLILTRMFPTLLVFILFGLVAWKMRKIIKQKLKNKFQRKNNIWKNHSLISRVFLQFAGSEHVFC